MTLAELPSIAILLPDLRGGGAERGAVNLANGFARRGYAVGMVLLAAAEARHEDFEFPRDL